MFELKQNTNPSTLDPKSRVPRWQTLHDDRWPLRPTLRNHIESDVTVKLFADLRAGKTSSPAITIP
jgi:hypothetical protein